MADYGHDLLFGTFLTPAAQDAPGVLDLAELTDELGLDLLGVQDHPYQPAFLDAWTLLSVIAARTSRVRVFPAVANLPLRPPAVLARSAASLDILSGGRVELGLGAGAFWEAIAAQGGPRRTPAESVTSLGEAIHVIRSLWTPGRGVRLDGEHYGLHGAKPGPFPAHDMGIWVGAYKPRMLRLIGQLADGWLPSSPYAPPEQLPGLNKLIDEAAVEAGRDPAAIRRLYVVAGSFTGNGFLQGPPAVWVEQLAELTLHHGFSAYILASDDRETIQRFAGEVAPALRELVTAERSGAPTTVDTALGVTPTPAPVGRRSDERPWDESTRPTGPVPDPGRVYTAHERATAQHLIDIHDHLRAELAQVRDLAEQVAAGVLNPAAARSTLNTIAMRQNNWTLGAYCESFCRFVTMHHTAEDRMVFPRLRMGDPRLAPVVDRLQAEHLIIHDVIERIDRALVAFVASPESIGELRAAVDLLTDALLSHLSYEERELVEPLARLGFQ